jgi:hypothetical protein
MCVKFTTIPNKGRQFPSAEGNRKRLTNDRHSPAPETASGHKPDK